MEIKEIKALLSIETVLKHYSLKPDKQYRLLCPFHPDKTPSLQIYPKTNTFCCFSSNCTAGTGDMIQFIQLMEKCNKHEALVKAASLVGANANPSSAVPALGAKLFTEADELEKAALMGKVFSYFKKALPLTKKAVDYLQGRSIDYTQHEIGYNSGGLHGEGKNHHLVASMEKYGLLKPLAVRGHSVWARDCVIFPLRNAEHKIVSLYGRSITNDSDQRHFYLAGREGLYPGYPKAATTRLILVESIIAAATTGDQRRIRDPGPVWHQWTDRRALAVDHRVETPGRSHLPAQRRRGRQSRYRQALYHPAYPAAGSQAHGGSRAGGRGCEQSFTDPR